MFGKKKIKRVMAFLLLVASLFSLSSMMAVADDDGDIYNDYSKEAIANNIKILESWKAV